MHHLTFEEAAAIEADSKPLINKPFLFKPSDTRTAKLTQIDMVIRGEGYDLLFSFDNSRKLAVKDFMNVNKPAVTFSKLSKDGFERLLGLREW